MAGRNNAEQFNRMYDSIERQNYTNYRIVHIDDYSDDDTEVAIEKYLKKHPEMAKRTTFYGQK